jgi:hypothetical protein
MQEHIDPYDKRADCIEDYISPPFNLPPVPASGSTTDTSTPDQGTSIV